MRIYGFGSNSFGQLGIGHQNDTAMALPCLITARGPNEPEERLGKITAGGNTTFLCMKSGMIYVAGLELFGPLDAPKTPPVASSSFHQATFIEGNESKLCSATWEASIIVSSNDEVFVCGRGSKGELGLGPDRQAAFADIKLKAFLPKATSIVDIASSVSHTVAVLSNGEVYGWGNGRRGQLGEPAEIVWAPRRIEGLNFRVVRAVCGRDFTFLVADPSEGHHLILGSDKRGVRSQAPTHIQHWKDLGASWGSIFVLDRDGKVRSWGRDDRGQLASSDLPRITKIAVGSEHVVALSGDGRVLCWGWGEHGNCGERGLADVHTEAPWIDISGEHPFGLAKVLGVGAGCATSFFWTE